jgi:hypothetical protein
MGLVPKELPSSEMGGLGEPRQAKPGLTDRVVPLTIISKHSTAYITAIYLHTFLN